jgi:hypothetical protein
MGKVRSGKGLWGEGCLNGAGPAGWLRESGSRLPHSKAFGGARSERAGRRTPCAGRAVMLPAVQSLRLAGSEGLVRRGLVGRGCLNGAGPAGWHRESGSRLPHSKAFGRAGAEGLAGALRARGEL